MSTTVHHRTQPVTERLSTSFDDKKFSLCLIGKIGGGGGVCSTLGMGVSLLLFHMHCISYSRLPYIMGQDLLQHPPFEVGFMLKHLLLELEDVLFIIPR